MAIVGRIARILLFLLLVVVVFAGGAIGVLTLTEKGRDRLAALISDVASTQDMNVRLTGLSGIWSGRLRLDGLVLADRDGPWLSARELAVDWSPLDLLRMTFSADRVAAGTIDFQRLPRQSSEPASEGGGLSLPVDISIRQLDLPHVELGAEVAGGHVATIAAGGRAVVQANPLDVDADLTARRTDGVAGEVNATVGFAPNQNRLDVDIRASEPAGGIVAGLLGLPGRPAIDMAVSGSGPASDWKGSGTFAVDGALVASVEGSHRTTAEGSAVAIRGDGAFSAFLPERFRHLAAGETQFDIAGTLTPSGGIFVDRGRVDGTAISAQASGQIDPEGASDFSLELTAAGGGVPLDFGTEEAPIELVVGSASVRALGDGRAPQLDISVQLPSVATNTVRMTSMVLALDSEAFDLERRVGPFTGNVTAAALAIDNPTVEPLVAGEIRAEISGVLEPDTLTVSSGSLRSDAIDGGFDGRVSLADGSIRLGLQATVQSAALPEAARPILGETVALSTALNRAPDGNVSAEDLSVVSGGLSLDGRALLSAGQIDAQLDGTLADIAPAVPGGSGAVQLSAKASGPFTAPTVTATVTSSTLAYNGRALSDLELTAGGSLDGGSPDITMALKASLEGQPVAMNGVISLAEAERAVRDLSLVIGQNTIAGTLTLGESFLPQGALALQLPDLASLARMAGQSIEGSLAGTVEFSHDGSVGTVRLDVGAPSITAQGINATDVTVDATVSNYILDPTLSGDVGATLAGLVPGQPPVAFRGTVNGNASALDATGSLAMDGAELSDFTATYRQTDAGSVVEASGTGSLARFLPEQARALAQGETRFDVSATLGAGGSIDIGRAVLANAAIEAQARGQYVPTGDADITVTIAPAAAGAALRLGTADAPVSLIVDGATLRVTGPSKRPVIDLSAQLAAISAPQAEVSDLSLSLRSDGFDIANRNGAFNAEVRAASVALTDQMAAPVLGGSVTARVAGSLAGDTLTIESGGIASAALSSGVRGTVSLAGGPTSIDLRAEVARSALPSAARPVLGEHLALAAQVRSGADGSLAIENLTANSGALSATGSVRMTDGAIDAQIEAALADIAGLAPDAAGAVRLTAGATGPLTAPEISARLTSDRIAVGTREIRDLDLTAAGPVAGENAALQLAIKAQAEGQPVDGRATVSLAEAGRVLREIDLSLGQNRVSGSLALDDAARPVGTLTLDLPDLALLAALAGQEVQGAMSGTAIFAVEDDTPQIRLSARSERIARDTIAATDVSIDATVSDYLDVPTLSGDIGATLAGLVPGQPPAVLRVSLEGTPADLGANGTLAMDGQTITDFNVSFAQSADGGRVEAKGDVVLARFLPEGARIVAPDPTRFDIAAVLDGGAVRIERAALTNAALSVNASGRVDPAGTLDVTVDVAAGSGDASLALGTAEAPLDIALRSARLRASGPFARPVLDMTADLASVIASGARVSDLTLALKSEGFDVESRTGPVSGSATAGAVSLDNETVAPLIAGAVRATFAGALSPESLSISDGSLSTDAVDARISGSVSLAGGGVSLDLSSDIAAAALPAAARPVLGERVSVSAKVARTDTGDLSVEDLKLASGPLAAQGQARLAAGTIDARIDGTLGTVAPLAEQASGAVAFRVAATGELVAPDLDISVTSERMTVAEQVIEDLVLTATGKADLANPEANVTIGGRVGGDALSGRAVIATTDGSRALRDLEFSLGKNRISGSLALDENFVPSGSIDIDVPDISPLAALALEEIEGSVRGNIVFDRQNGAPRARVALNSGSIRRGDLSLRQADVQAVVTDMFASPGVSGHVRVGELRSGTTVVSGTDLELSQDGTWTRFTGGANVTGMPVRASGRVQLAGGTTTVELTTAEATVQGVRTALSRPTSVRITDGTAALDRLALNLGGGTATVTGTAGERMNLDVRLSALPASLANAFAAGLGAEGPISGEVRVTGTGANPNVRFDLSWTGAQTSQTRAAGIGALTVRTNGTFVGNRLTFDASAAGGGGIDFRGGGSVALGGPPQLDLNFRGTVPLAVLDGQTAGQGIGLSGTASLDVAVRGPATAPAITGSVRSSDARVVYVPAGIALEGLSIDVALGQGRATISRLSGTLSSGGTVTVAGTVGIAGNGFPADLTIRVAEGRYTDGKVVTTTVNADLAIRGPLAGSPALTGTVDLARTVIQIPERLPSSLEALNVQHRDAPAAVIDQALILNPPAATGSGSAMTVDITVNAPQRIFVQGRGLDAELGGSLRLVGPLSAPQATGEFELRRGRLSLLGRRLNFTEGTITFAGSLVPYLNFAAESSASDATVTVRVSGPADNPKFSFSSVPALPEDEVLARLIFGRAMGSLSPLQIAQLADAAATLAGRGGSTSLLNNLRDRLGVDDLDVRTNEDGGTSVAVGKYLNDRTYLTLEAGDRAGSSKAAIDLDIGRGLKLRGEAFDDGQARGGIFFEREY